MRKPRSDAKLLSLPIEQQEQIAAWLTIENRSYAEVVKACQEQFGMKVSTGALVNFYQTFAAPMQKARSAEFADEFAKLLGGDYDKASLERARQLAFEAMMSPRPDIGTAKALLKVIGDSAKIAIQQERLSLDARKVALLEQKAAQADAAKGVLQDKTLSDEERNQRMRSIFHL